MGNDLLMARVDLVPVLDTHVSLLPLLPFLTYPIAIAYHCRTHLHPFSFVTKFSPYPISHIYPYFHRDTSMLPTNGILQLPGLVPSTSK